jgi:hypothetical protein
MRSTTVCRAAAMGVIALMLLAGTTVVGAPRPPPGGGVLQPPPIGPQSTCPPLTGAGTDHPNSLNTPQTWTAAASPHRVPNDLTVYSSITLEPCSVVLIAAGRTLTIPATGALIAAGAPLAPVTIDAMVAGAGWASIRNSGGTLSLTHTIVRYGGNPGSTNAAYTGALQMLAPTGAFHVDDVMVALSLSQGIYINTGSPVGFDASSQNLVVVGSAGYPVHVNAGAIGSVPTGTYRGGNGHDAIAISGAAAGPIATSQTLNNRGVPYHVGSGMDGGRLDVNANGSGPVAVLTIEPGVTMLFPTDGNLNIDPQGGANYTNPAPARGALRAIGTPKQPIVFTSDQGTASVPGSWLGLSFGGKVDPQTIMQYATVGYAGGATVSGSNSCPVYGRNGANYAAIRILGPVPGQFITYTDIEYSARDGIDRGWRADDLTDFVPLNAFNKVDGCFESVPRMLNGGCPKDPIVCPQP